VQALFLSVSSSQQQPCALSLLPEFVTDVRLHQRLDDTVNLVA